MFVVLSTGRTMFVRVRVATAQRANSSSPNTFGLPPGLPLTLVLYLVLPFSKPAFSRDLEGIVSKLALAQYRSGRTKTWLKTKCFTELTFVVIGTDRDRKTGLLRALLANNDGAGLNYAGAAFIALASDERAQFYRRA